jgi:hypothetical protein
MKNPTYRSAGHVIGGLLASRVHVLVLGALFVFFSAGCIKQSEESSVQQLQRMTTYYGIQWPTNYLNDQAGSLRYSARDSAKNIIVVVRVELDEASYEAWFSQIANQMKVYDRFSANVDPVIVERFPWYNPGVYPAAQVTRLVCETNGPAILVAKLTVHAVKSNGVRLLYISSQISER